MEEVKARDVQILPEVEEDEVDIPVEFCQNLFCISKPEVHEHREAGLSNALAGIVLLVGVKLQRDDPASCRTCGFGKPYGGVAVRRPISRITLDFACLTRRLMSWPVAARQRAETCLAQRQNCPVRAGAIVLLPVPTALHIRRERAVRLDPLKPSPCCRRRRCERIAKLRAFPSSAEEGWLRDQEKSRSHISSRRRGGVGQEFPDHTTPSAPSKDASRYFLEVASTPPLLRRGTRAPLQFVHTFIDRAYRRKFQICVSDCPGFHSHIG